MHSIKQCRLSLKIGEALRQVDGAAVGGQLRHDGENGGADPGQLGVDGNGRCEHERP